MQILRASTGGEPPYALIETQTVAAAGCRREVYGRIDLDAVPEEARRLADEILGLSPPDQPAVALALGFEYDRRRLKVEELLPRLIMAVYLTHCGAREIFASPVAYQSRPRWDLYSPDAETLVCLNHLVEEADAIQHVTHKHARTVLWLPPLVERAGFRGWYILRYTALEPWPKGRNWFDETARQNERQSAERRSLQVDARGLEGRVPAVRALLDHVYAVLEEGRYLTLAEDV